MVVYTLTKWGIAMNIENFELARIILQTLIVLKKELVTLDLTAILRWKNYL